MLGDITLFKMTFYLSPMLANDLQDVLHGKRSFTCSFELYCQWKDDGLNVMIYQTKLQNITDMTDKSVLIYIG